VRTARAVFPAAETANTSRRQTCSRSGCRSTRRTPGCCAAWWLEGQGRCRGPGCGRAGPRAPPGRGRRRPVLAAGRIGREFAATSVNSGVWAAVRRERRARARASPPARLARGCPLSGPRGLAGSGGIPLVGIRRRAALPEAPGQTVHDPVLGLVSVACAQEGCGGRGRPRPPGGRLPVVRGCRRAAPGAGRGWPRRAPVGSRADGAVRPARNPWYSGCSAMTSASRRSSGCSGPRRCLAPGVDEDPAHRVTVGPVTAQAACLERKSHRSAIAHAAQRGRRAWQT